MNFSWVLKARGKKIEKLRNSERISLTGGQIQQLFERSQMGQGEEAMDKDNGFSRWEGLTTRLGFTLFCSIGQYGAIWGKIGVRNGDGAELRRTVNTAIPYVNFNLCFEGPSLVLFSH